MSEVRPSRWPGWTKQCLCIQLYTLYEASFQSLSKSKIVQRCQAVICTWTLPDWIAGQRHSERVQAGKQSLVGGSTFQLTQKLLRRDLTAAPQTPL